MRKEIAEFIANCNAQMSIERLKDVCENEEELCAALSVCLPLIEQSSVFDSEIPPQWKEAALQAFESVRKEEITEAQIQKTFGISYAIAWRLKAWIIKTKQGQ